MKVPQAPDLGKKLDNILRRLKKLENNRGLGDTTVSHGSITLDGGSLSLMSGGVEIARIGEFKDSSGNTQVGVTFNRPNGKPAFRYDSVQGFIGIYDETGDYVFTDDTDSGHGVARPYLQIPMHPLRVQDAAAVTDSAWTPVYGNWMYPTCPIVVSMFKYGMDPGVSGEIRLTVDGVQVGRTIADSAGWPSNNWMAGPWPVWDTVNLHQVQIEARLTGGTGNVYVAPQNVFQGESALMSNFG